MANKLGSFAFVGIRNMKVFDNQGGLVTTLKHLKDIDISNESSTTYLRGGEGNKKLLAISGDASATVTANQATVTTKLWEIITGNAVETKSVPTGVEERHTVSGAKVTLKNDPSSGEKVNIHTVDAFGRDDKVLTLGNPAENADQFSIAGKVITVHTSVKGDVRVDYKHDKEVTVVTAKPNMAKNYRFEADLLCKDVETKDAFIAKLVIPNGKIQEQFSMSTANSADEPTAIPLAIDCLEDANTGSFYTINFYEDVTAQA